MQYTQLTLDFAAASESQKIPFCFDEDINQIVEMIQNLAKTNNFPLGTIEFEIWSHVPNLGYRLMVPVSVTQDNVDNYFKDVKKIITYGEEHDIEVSSLTSGFYRGSSSANIYISTLFMDKRRKLKATQGRLEKYELSAA